MKANKFKTTLLSNLIETCQPNRHYDSLNDVFSFLFVSSKERLYVYYIDDYVSLLCRYSDNEVVGIRVDSFLKIFLPGLMKNNSVWKMSETGIKLDNFDFKIKCEIKEKRAPKYTPTINPAIIESEPVYLDCLQPA